MRQLLTLLALTLCLGLAGQETKDLDLGYRNVLGGSFYLNTSTNNSLPIFAPGSIVLSSGSISSPTVTEANSKGYNFSPYYGRQLNNNWMVGIIGGYAFSKSETLGFYDQISSIVSPLANTTVKTYDYSLFARYFFRADQKFRLFIEPRIGQSIYIRENQNITFFNFNTTTTRNDSERKVLKLQVIPGLSYSLSKRCNLLVSAGFLSYQRGTETFNSSQQEGIIDIFTPSNPGVTTTTTSKDVSDLSLSLRSSSLAFSFEIRF